MAKNTTAAGALLVDPVADQTLLAELDELVRETYTLWDEEWVGFSWRNYTYAHVQRVVGLAHTLGRMEGVDGRVLEYAALLHDATKSYDGEIIVDAQGKRIVDEHGFWRNGVLPPARQNAVTELYGRLGLEGTLHSISGAAVADALLAERGFAADFREHVAEAIRSHLKVDEQSSLEGRILYDADTIDANIGLPAFYRNIQISLHGQDRQYARRGEDFPHWLREHFQEYVGPYLRERLPAWNAGKRNDFVPKLTTKSGRHLAAARLARLDVVLGELSEELEDYEQHVRTGQLAVVRWLMDHRRNPRMPVQLDELEREVLPGQEAGREAYALVAAVREEMLGRQ